MILSFSVLTPALLAGAKTVTRRTWTLGYATQVIERYRAGVTFDAYDRSPRNGGKRVATLRLVQRPVLRGLHTAPESDYAAEGFQWFDEHPDERTFAMPSMMRMAGLVGDPADYTCKRLFDEWREIDRSVYVVRFEVLARC